MEKIIFKEESYSIVGAAMDVWNTLGYGFLERVYENALLIELVERGFDVEQQYPLEVYYRGRSVGKYIVDILVNRAILLEIKSAQAISAPHIAQTLNYLHAIELRLGIILNFAPKTLEHKRIVL